MRVVVRAFCLCFFLPSLPSISALSACFPTKIQLTRFSKNQASPSQAARLCEIFTTPTITGKWATPLLSHLHPPTLKSQNNISQHGRNMKNGLGDVIHSPIKKPSFDCVLLYCILVLVVETGFHSFFFYSGLHPLFCETPHYIF